LTVNGSDPAPQEILTLFLVVIDLDGSSRVVLDQSERFVSHRLATAKDVLPALANTLSDFQALKAAEAVFSFQMQAARQAQEAAAREQERAAQEQEQQ
jgi:hypothetical protein